LLVVTSRFPFGSQEAYLTAELRELLAHVEQIAVAPIRPPTGKRKHHVPEGVEVLAWPLFGAGLLRRASAAARAKPRETFAAISAVLGSKDPGRLKNAALILKGLALAGWAMERRIDHIHAYWISAPATVAFIASKVGGIPWSSTAHRWDIYERNAFDVKAASARFVRTISNRGKVDLGERMPALADRIVHLALGTTVPPAPARARGADPTFHLICPAALVKVKGHADLLGALAQLRAWGVPVRCTFAGDGPLRTALQDQAAALGLSDVVEFAGFVAQDELHARYRAGRYAAVVLASRADGETAMEGLPSALIEAMAFGVPVVASDSGSIGELIDDRTGALVRPGDVGALARAILNVRLNPDTTEARAERAYQTIAERHDVRVQMREFASVLCGERSL
jgi:glycosyltransferase involved in cell wall biosynthesis